MCFLAAGEKVCLGMQSARRMLLYPQAVSYVFEAANNMEKRQNVNSFLKISVFGYEMVIDMFQSCNDFIGSQGTVMIFFTSEETDHKYYTCFKCVYPCITKTLAGKGGRASGNQVAEEGYGIGLPILTYR